MTVKLKAGPAEGSIVIDDVGLPVELNVGEWITGGAVIRNVGEADLCAILFITEWNGMAYGAIANMAKDEVLGIEISSGLIAMPNQDATITIYGCHAEPGGEWLIDSTEFKIDDVKTH
ncbi:hypothetical protein KKE60_04305 [Patescibacteria group bacterium]|nr:hypothetical protein [Patescibacteria group bacterium]